MIEVTVKNLALVKKKLRDNPGKINVVLANAVNRAAQNAKTNFGRMVAKEYTVSSTAATRSITLTKASVRDSSPSALVRSIRRTFGTVNLAKFKHLPGKRPVGKNPKGGYRVQVHKGGSMQVVPRGFLSKDGQKFLQRRTTRSMPIKGLTMDLFKMMTRREVIEWVENEARTMLNKRVLHELQRVTEAVKK